MKKLLLRLLAKWIRKLRGAPATWYFCPGHPEHYNSTEARVYCPVCQSLLAVM